MSKVTLLLRRFLGQDVAFVSVFALDFASTRQRKSLLCTRFSFYFWHGYIIDLENLLLGRRSRLRRKNQEHPFSLQFWQLLYLRHVFQGLRELKEQDFASLLKYNRPAHEMHI